MRNAPLMAMAVLGLACMPAVAGDVFIVAHASVNLSADEVREVFLGEKQFAGSVKLAPLDNAAAQADFQSKVLKVDSARYAAIWSKKGFREGLTPPLVRGTDQDVINAVKSTPGTVGYVTKAAPDVKVIQKF